MIFENEYLMTRGRNLKWSVPKFWKVGPIWYIYCFLFVAGIIAWWYFDRVDVAARWKTVGAFLAFVALYRGVAFYYMKSDKQFRVDRQQLFDNEDWTCKVQVRDDKVRMFVNGKLTNRIEWKDIIAFKEAKSYFKLATDEFNEGPRLDKECFKKGDTDTFRQWMLDNHPEIPYGPEDPMFNR